MSVSRNLRFVVFRYSHHSPHSGYSRVAEFGSKLFNSETIRANGPLSRRLIRERMLWKISRGTPGYDRMSMAVELAAIRRMLREKRAIYHFLYGETTYHYAGLLNHRNGNDVVATFHLPPSSIRDAVQTDWHVQKLSAVVCVGRSQQEFFSTIVGRERVFFAPLGVATDFFMPPAPSEARNPNLCLVVGENFRDYPTLRGVIELVGYWRPKTEFIVVTNPKYRSLLGEHPNLTYRAGIPEGELLKLYQSASVLLMPLHDATANNAILEGMACGLPLIVSDVGSVRDYLHPQCGLLIPYQQARAMAEAVVELLADDASRCAMSVRGREHALTFSWEESVRKLSPIYEALAS
jgi:glycosyltransferase involved in cell wall biosynthesis